MEIEFNLADRHTGVEITKIAWKKRLALGMIKQDDDGDVRASGAAVLEPISASCSSGSDPASVGFSCLFADVQNNASIITAEAIGRAAATEGASSAIIDSKSYPADRKTKNAISD